MIAALLLAAGASRRFGAPKLGQDLDGRPVVRWSVDALAGLANELVVVVAPEHDIIARALDGVDLRLVVNPQPAEGIATSLAAGIRALGPEVDAALVALGDEPLLPRSAHERVLARYREGGAAIVESRYRGTRGHPVLFDRGVFPELVALTGDRGARAVVERTPSRVALVEMHESQPIDVDVPEDLARLRRGAQLSEPGVARPPSGTRNP